VTDGIKSLAEIQGNGIGNKERGDCMKDGNKGSSGEAGRTKSRYCRGSEKSWIDVTIYNK